MIERENVAFKVFTGSSNVSLARGVCECMGVELGALKIQRFSDGEIYVEVDSDVAGLDVFVIQSTCAPVGDNLLEFLLIVDALKRASAKNITAVLPYYGYSRQDKKLRLRTAISAKLIANLLHVSGVTALVAVELHSDQIQGFFDIPVCNLSAESVMSDYVGSSISLKNSNDLVVVSPDAGGMVRARAFSGELGCGLGIIDKYRPAPNKVSGTTIIGNVSGKSAIVYDDMVDTAGTLVKTAEILVEHGVSDVHACCIHPVLSGPAIDRIEDSVINSLVVMDTIPLDGKSLNCSKIKVVSCAGLLSKSMVGFLK